LAVARVKCGLDPLHTLMKIVETLSIARLRAGGNQGQDTPSLIGDANQLEFLAHQLEHQVGAAL